MTTQLQLAGLTCDHCVNQVQHCLEALEGVQHVSVDLAEQRAIVEYEDADPGAMVAAVVAEGYEARLIGA